MRISIPLDLSSSPFIPLPVFIRSRRPTTLLALRTLHVPLRLNTEEKRQEVAHLSIPHTSTSSMRLVHPLDGSPDLVVGTMKKRFVSGNLFFELEIVNKSTISITLRVIDKSYPSFTGPLVIISRETNFRYYQVLQSPKEVLQYRSLDHQCTRFGVTTHQDVRLVMKSQS
jgi:hypothetical protein